MGEYSARLGLLRRMAESKMQMGGGVPETFAWARCAQDPALTRSEKSLALAGAQGNLGISAVARQMRRLFGPRGGAARRDAWAATDADANSNDDNLAACVA